MSNSRNHKLSIESGRQTALIYLDYTTASAALLERQKVIGQTDGLAQPVQHNGLQFSAGGTRCPREANAADAVAQHVAQYGGK